MTLAASNLSCIRQERCIFQGVDFSLSPGRVLWVKGPNGSGKSSLLRVLACLLKPASGEFLWNGKSVGDDPMEYQREFSYIGHQDALKGSFSPRENLSFWSKYRGSSDVAEAITTFELDKIADYPTQNLSAGQKKRSNLARLLISNTPLWILDEPISSLDSHYIDLFRSVLKKHIAAKGMAVLATHQDLGTGTEDILDISEYAGDLS
ncbi:heme ABC exporter ATP-binding protein CcmA [Sneathiella limimaris]|uniref:heme ABC exporter ATP-binding protein CcmA n=1 Tax=Sneathiella limimaris TaxID=1964213 RepID=UPI00146D2BD1|nr:heme ABC exporter ATP-binding protein CcmA [Sneathiella limimaris]